ncbi:probable disease resistance protein At5g45490 [Quercus lobata]|uniref:probable disease resistance protein At5g45490 n=1 Tax=Quercus lobata TaxID=97700 RepID=UPI001244539B|nr:probable disease resistance protein At5g45490 [Quercus lobata]
MKMSHKSTHVSTVASRVNSYRRSSRLVDAKKVHGFDTQLISLEKMVQQRQSSDQFKAVAIVGKRGVGKTTLCQVLFNKPEVQAVFLPRIWVCMSWQPTEHGDRKTTTVKRMLTCLGVDEKTIQSIIDSVPAEADRLSSLLYALHLQLTGKKYLIVLDDAIEEGDDADKKKKKGDDAIKEGDDADQKKKKGDDAIKEGDDADQKKKKGDDTDQKKKKADVFKERNKWLADLDSPITEKEKWGKCLAFGLPKGHGGTVIVTSRDENLAKVMVGEKNLLHLRPLLDPMSCASIFNDHIKDEQKLKKDLEKEFLKKCAGLPLAATMMGKIKSEEPEEKNKTGSPTSYKEELKNETELPAEQKAQPEGEDARSPKDDAKIKSEEDPEGAKPIKQLEKDPRSSIGSKDDKQIKSEELPAEAEPGPHQEGAAHNEIIEEAASGTN